VGIEGAPDLHKQTQRRAALGGEKRQGSSGQDRGGSRARAGRGTFQVLGGGGVGSIKKKESPSERWQKIGGQGRTWRRRALKWGTKK